jgi:hypothetical protein
MNTLLDKLLKQNKVSPKNSYEICQIYSLLPPVKQKNLIDNFSVLIGKINKIEEGMKIEQNILLTQALSDIRSIEIE